MKKISHDRQSRPPFFSQRKILQHRNAERPRPAARQFAILSEFEIRRSELFRSSVFGIRILGRAQGKSRENTRNFPQQIQFPLPQTPTLRYIR